MKIQVFSDLHGDVEPAKPITVEPDIDAVVVAGDVCQGAEDAFAAVRQIVPMHIPIVTVLGNHEFYGRCLPDELAHARAVAPLYGIHLLENDAIEIGGVRFVGASLWTNYALFGETNLSSAMNSARNGLNDHRRIAWAKQPWQRFRPQEALLLHCRSRAFISAELARPFSGPTAVVSHHTPHPGSLHPRYTNDLLSAAFVSDLSELIEAEQPTLWVHGHVHHNFDYRVGDTRVVCNAHDYGNENPDFEPNLVVDIER